METLRGLTFFLLFYTAFCATPKVIEESHTMFYGEDFPIPLPLGGAEVLFQSVIGPAEREVTLMKDGSLTSRRVTFNQKLHHLVLENLGESDEGIYTVKPNDETQSVKRITIIVRDCSFEHSSKYGDQFFILISSVSQPITFEFRHSAVEANRTSDPPATLVKEGVVQVDYQKRVILSDSRVTLLGVTNADEGSFTVKDKDGKSQRKVCLNVKEHLKFDSVPYMETLKIDLIINSSLVRVLYTPDYDAQTRVIADKGELIVPEELGLEGRIFLEDSVCILKDVIPRDAGVFQVKDLHDFLVAKISVGVKAYQLPPLYVTIIALVALLVVLLLVCLVSCLVKVRKRAAKNRAIEKIAQNAGKDEGDIFRQVVQDAVTKHTEETTTHSQKDDITEKSQSTEVSIKGLEVSKEVNVHDKNLETSDSGVGFNTTGLPMDSDTDAPTFGIPDSEILSCSAAPDVKATPNQIPESKTALTSTPKAAPMSDPKPVSVKSAAPPIPKPEPISGPKPEVSPEPRLAMTPELKPATTPEPKPAKTPEPKPAKTPEPKPAKTPEPTPALTLEPKSALSSEPKQAVTPESKSALTPEPKQAVTPESKSALTPETKKAVTPEPKSALTPEPKQAVTPEPKSALTPEPKQAVTPEPKSALTPEPKQAVTPEPKSALTPEPKQAVTPDPKPAVTPEPKPVKTPEPKQAITPEPKPTLAPTPESKTPVIPSPEPKPAVTPEPEPTVSITPEAKPPTAPTPDHMDSPDSKPAVTLTLDPKPTMSPTSEPKPAVTPTPVTPDPKPTLTQSPDLKPTTNGTPDPKPTSGSPVSFEVTTKTPPPAELISSGSPVAEAKLESSLPSDTSPSLVAEDAATS